MIYDDLRAVASEVFAEFRQGVVEYVRFDRPTGGTPDDPGEPVPVPTRINATVKPVSQRYIDGSLITGSEVEVAMPNDDVVPTMDGMVRIDGVQHKIVRLMPRPAAGVPVSFTLIVKR